MRHVTRGDRLEFAEFLAAYGGQLGFPPMAGRVWGWLLVCDPPEQSAAQLAEALGASRGAVSTTTALLIKSGMVERVALSGRRSHYYRAAPAGALQLLKARMSLVSEMRGIAERGLELLRDEPQPVRKRLQEYHDFYTFCETEFPALIEKWERSAAGNAARAR